MLMSSEMMAGGVVIGILGVLTNTLLIGIQRFSAPWAMAKGA